MQTAQVSASPSSEMEFMWKTFSEIKRKPAGSNDLFLSLFKDRDEVLKSESKTLGSVWSNEQVTEYWYESVIVRIYRRSDKLQ